MNRKYSTRLFRLCCGTGEKRVLAMFTLLPHLCNILIWCIILYPMQFSKGRKAWFEYLSICKILGDLLMYLIKHFISIKNSRMLLLMITTLCALIINRATEFTNTAFLKLPVREGHFCFAIFFFTFSKVSYVDTQLCSAWPPCSLSHV